MGEITLHPNRVVVYWNRKEETLWSPSILDLSKYFFYALSIDPAFTLGDLFALLDREDIEFLEAVLDERVAPLLEEARMVAKSPVGEHVDFLHVYNVHQGGYLYREFDGWGAWDEYDGACENPQDSPRRGPIAVDLMPLHELVGAPLRYDPELVFHRRTGEEEYRTTIDITLIDFLKAVFFELTFHGGPQEREEVLQELRQHLDEIRRREAEWIADDDVLKIFGEDRDGPDGEV